MGKKQMIRALQKHKDRLENERDALRDIQSDADEMAGLCDRAVDDLMNAIDALSEIV
jgi:hypothetical protein